MDVLLLAQDVTWGGSTGDSVHLRALSRHLVARGNRVRIVARSGGTEKVAAVGGLEPSLLQSRWDLAFGFVRRPLAFRRILGLLRQERPDLVYTRGFGDPVEAFAARFAGLPMVFEVNGDALAEARAQRRVPQSGWRTAGSIALARWGFRQAQRLVAVTDQLRDDLTRRFRVPVEKIRVIPNGVDTELFRPADSAGAREQLGLPSEVPVLVFVGNLAPWQGVDVVIRGFAAFSRRQPDAVLLIVGGGQEASRLGTLAADLRVANRIRFTGPVSHERVPQYIVAADVCLAHGVGHLLRSGSSAVKIREYLACGRPVIASRLPDLEFLEGEDLGRLVPHDDARALADAIESVLADPTWRRSVAERGRRFALRHSWAVVAAAVEDVCREATSS